MDSALPTAPWIFSQTLFSLGLALGIGLFVGLEREWRGKEAGLRTFGFAGLIGGLGGVLGDAYALLSLALLGLLTAFLNWQGLREGDGAELTTSAALLVVGLTGVLCGQGETFTPVAVGVVTAALLAWKESLSGFSLGLTEAELRSAILLALLTFVVYPVLPDGPVDPWGLIDPREAWVTVILIAGIGFVNYVLLKTYGTRGVELAGFFGGLVNSTVTVTELATRAREGGEALVGMAYRGILLATAAMAVRNLLLLGIFAATALVGAAVPLGLILVASLGLSRLGPSSDRESEAGVPTLTLESPFSLRAALKFGLFFLGLEVVGTQAQAWLGQWGFYAVSVAGGVFSSGSAVASAATLAAHGTITPEVAGTGAVLASLASAAVSLPLVARVASQRQLTSRLAWAIGAILVLGILGAALQHTLMPRLLGGLLAG